MTYPPEQSAPRGYAAPPPGYPAQYGPPPGWAPAPRAPKRPGMATATGVVGIILGVQMFPYAALALISAAQGTDQISAEDAANDHGALAIAWTTGILAVLAAVVVFVGAIQLLSGSNAWVLRVGAALAIAAIWIATVWFLATIDEFISGSDFDFQAKTTVVVIAVVLSIAPALVLGLSLSPAISRWFTKRKALRAQGMDI